VTSFAAVQRTEIGSSLRWSAPRRGSAAPAARRRNGAARSNAIARLKADHREVEQMFESFEKARGEDRKKGLATRKAQLESQPGVLKTVKKLKDAGKGLVTRALTEV
jgi:hypothetical protein